jgi:trans-2,3-dihydro-3-hydroxyanthranilate isomerase
VARRGFTLLDVFTDRPLEGNGLAVVHDADGLDDATMLAFAREMRLSETTFVQAPQRAGADYRNRIWDLRQ